MAKVIIDFGNAWTKVYEPHNGLRFRRPHYIAELPSAGMNRVTDGKHKTTHLDYIVIGGKAYAFAEKAKRNVLLRPRGAARYTRGYYGIGVFHALTQVWPEGHSNVELIASYAPGDYTYVKELVKAVKGKWTGYTVNGKVQYNITSVRVFDEPFGGWANLLLTKEGNIRQASEYLMSSTSYVLDVGGHTVDGLAVDPNGQIDYTSARSHPTGVLHLLETYQDELKTAYPDVFQRQTAPIDIGRLEKSLADGYYPNGKVDLDMQETARELKLSLVNEVIEIFEAAGGALNYDYVVLTGGGAGLLVGLLRDSLPNVRFVMAHTASEIQYANVLGGDRFFRMLEIVQNGKSR